MRHIFGFYGPSLVDAKIDSRDSSKAEVTFSNRKDALYAFEHLSQSENKGRQTLIDGQPIGLTLLKDLSYEKT